MIKKIKIKIDRNKTVKGQLSEAMQEAYDAGAQDERKKNAIVLEDERLSTKREYEKLLRMHEDRENRSEKNFKFDTETHKREILRIENTFKKKEKKINETETKLYEVVQYWKSRIDEAELFRHKLEGILTEYEETIHEINRKVSRLTGLRKDVIRVQTMIDKHVKSVFKQQPRILREQQKLGTKK